MNLSVQRQTTANPPSHQMRTETFRFPRIVSRQERVAENIGLFYSVSSSKLRISKVQITATFVTQHVRHQHAVASLI